MDKLPEIVGHADWMKMTSATLRKRSAELKALDLAIQKYERTPSQASLIELVEAFDRWKLAHGNGEEWRDSARNANKYADMLDQQIKGIGDTDVALGMPSFMEPALVNSRLGVLYLYSKLECNDMFKVLVEGAIDITTASLDYSADDARPAIERAKSALEKGQGTIGDAAKLAEEKVRARIKAREGKPSEVSSAILLDSNPPPPPSAFQKVWTEIREKIYSIAQKLLEMARAQWEGLKVKMQWAKANPGDTLMNITPGLLRKLCDFLTGHLLAAAAPFIGAGLDIAKGVANTIDAGLTKFREWSQAKGVELVIGHPGTIAEAIRRAMWFNVGKGLYDTLKGGANLGLQFASQGAASIVNLVWSIVEALAKTIWKLVEIARMRGVFAQAREFWNQRNQPGAIHLHPIQFNAWFKSHALMLPALPVLVLNTGICGDKMHFMKMFTDDKSIVTQASFDAGCRYIDSLKAWGSQYLGDTGFGFTSDDPVVEGLIDLAGKHEVEQGTADRVWKAVLGFLNA